MTRLGADPHELQLAATRLDASAARLREVRLRTDRRLAATWWVGPDAGRFRHRWQQVHGPALHAAALACTTRAQQLRRHAFEQVAASQSAGAPVPTTMPVGPLAGFRFEPLPRRVERGSLRLESGVELLSVGAAATVTIEHLVDGRRRVGVTDHVSAGVGAAATTSVAGAAEHIRLGPERTRTWTVAADDVPELLAGVLLAELAPGAGAASIGLAARFADAGLEWFGLHTPLDALRPAPPADSTEVLLRAGDGGSLRLGGATATSSGSVAVGLRRSSSGTSLVATWSQEEELAVGGTLAGRLRRQLGITWTPPVGTRITGRIEVPADAFRPDPPAGQVATIEFTGEQGHDQHTVRAAVDLDAVRRAAPAFGDALEQLASGRADAAAALLGGVALPPDSVVIDVAAGRIEGTSIELPISGGVGSLTPGVEGQVLTRR